MRKVTERKYEAMVYVITLLLSLFLSNAVKQKRLVYHKKKFSLLWIGLLPLLLLSALRFEVGTDYTVYTENQFQIILGQKQPAYWQVVDYEWGFTKLVLFCEEVLGDANLFFAIVATVFVILVACFIQEFSENIELSILLFVLSCFYNFSMNYIRQTLATAIFLYAIRYIETKKLLKFSCCIGLAALFHKTAIVYFVFYFLVRLQIGTKIRLLIIPITWILQIIIKRLLAYVIEATNFYSGYVLVSASANQENMIPLSLMGAFLGIYILLTIFVKEEYRTTSRGAIYSCLETVAIMLVLCGSVFQESIRIIYLFYPIYIVSVPFWFNRMENTRNVKVVKIAVITGFVYLFLYMILLKNYGNTLPYQSVIFH